MSLERSGDGSTPNAIWTAVKLLLDSARDPGSNLTTGGVCTEYIRSPHDRVGVPRVLRFPPTKDIQTLVV